jgi:putative zinc finger/helix-turn-helix YgiT family protein
LTKYQLLTKYQSNGFEESTVARQRTICEQCKTPMISHRENFLYKSCGLPNVTLEDVLVRRCAQCGEYEVEIPNMDGLHEKIAFEITRKPQKLTPEEIRFLRSYLGWSGAELAKCFDVDPTTVSRWETGAQRMGGVAERLLRLSVAHNASWSDYNAQVLAEVAKEEPTPLRLGLRIGVDSQWKSS